MWTKYDRIAAESLFFLGHQAHNEKEPIPYPREHRPHLAYYGTTDSGKSFAIEYILQQIADERAGGFCLIDPHGSLYWRLASHLRQHNITDRVVFWDINDPDFVVTYDPFRLPGQQTSAIAAGLTKAILSTLGEKAAATDQPQLKTLTQTGFRMLLDADLPFILAPEIFNPEDTMVKRAVAQRLGRSSLITAVGELPQFLDRFYQLVPTFRRIDNVFAVDQLRLSFVADGLNFKKLMDEGWIVLVNAAPTRQDPDAAYTFTRLLVSHLLAAAKDRDPNDPDLLPFFLVIDEASRYLSRDIADVLTQTRKFGLHLVAGMQGLEQAKLEDPYTYLALRECAGGQIVLKLLDPDEQEHFGKSFFRNHLTFKKVKHTRIHRYQEFVEEEYTIRNASRTTQRNFQRDPLSERSAGEDPFSEGDSETSGETIGTRLRPITHEEEDPEFYTADEELQLMSRWFSVREKGEEQRFGVARMPGMAMPQRIEIPELPEPLYQPDDLVDWMHDFKSGQAATIPLSSAQSQFEEIRERHLRELRSVAVPPRGKRPPKSSTEPIDF